MFFIVQTPERIEFSNLSSGHISSDHEESPDPIDEDEWTDRNFGASTAEHGSTDEEDSSSARLIFFKKLQKCNHSRTYYVNFKF